MRYRGQSSLTTRARCVRGQQASLWAPFILAFVAVTAHAAETPIAPGVYDELLLGYAPATHVLTGYFHSETAAGQFSCIFYLSGTASNGQARIETYFPETPREKIAGTINGMTKGEVLVALDEEPGGCAMVNPFADKARPASFTLASPHDWTEIRVIRANKSYFYDTPGAATHRKSYLVQGDGVGVKIAANGWLRVDYPGPDKTISGWIKEADLYPRP